jgi:predicted Zn-dependent protease
LKGGQQKNMNREFQLREEKGCVRLAHMLTASFILLTLAACQTVQTTQPGVVGVERKQTMTSLLPVSQVNGSAEKAYQQVLAEARKKNQLNRDAAQLARVKRIAERLIPATAAFRGDAPGWKWEVNVVSSEEVNAWCMPGGKIAFYTGLIDKLKITDDEMAAVMGHEIAHALREHGRERASRAALQGTVLNIGAALLGVGSAGVDVSSIILDITFNLPNSRTDETEADRIGVELAARAGFDPHAAVGLWQKMNQQGGGRGPKFLSTHPSPDDRIKDLQVYSERVMPLYQAAQKK